MLVLMHAETNVPPILWAFATEGLRGCCKRAMYAVLVCSCSQNGGPAGYRGERTFTCRQLDAINHRPQGGYILIRLWINTNLADVQSVGLGFRVNLE